MCPRNPANEPVASHTPVLRRLQNLAVTRLKTVPPLSHRGDPPPRFLEEPMDLDQVRLWEIDHWGAERLGSVEYLPQFTRYPADVAWRNGWVRDIREYQTFAALVFAYRFPNHPYSRFVRALKPETTDEDIRRLAETAST